MRALILVGVAVMIYFVMLALDEATHARRTIPASHYIMPSPEIVERVIEKPVEVEKIVVKEKPIEVEKIIVKEVPVERIVEKVVEVQPKIDRRKEAFIKDCITSLISRVDCEAVWAKESE